MRIVNVLRRKPFSERADKRCTEKMHRKDTQKRYAEKIHRKDTQKKCTEMRKNMATVKLTLENVDKEVLNEKGIVIVDFWATWCGPCKILLPIIESLSEQFAEMKICEVNVDEQTELVEKFDVMTVPTLMIFKDGKVVRTSIGKKTKSDILEMLKNL